MATTATADAAAAPSAAPSEKEKEETTTTNRVSDEEVAKAMDFDTERALANGQFRGRARLLNANQTLVEERIARIGQTSLVTFYEDPAAENGSESTRSLVLKLKKHESKGVISMSESWTDEALRYLRRERHSSSSSKLAALNYANCTYVGGNYSDGGFTRAQEEELCRQFPALFASMQTCKEAGAEWSSRMCCYRNHVFGACFGDGYSKAKNVLFTEEVQCLRGSPELSYRLLCHDANRVSAAFIEAAAPLFNRGRDDDFEEYRRNPKETYEKTFLNIFYAPKKLNPNYDVIVVGPWGCGAFGNDPVVVAQSFLAVIEEHDLLHRYKEIHFCLGRSAPVDVTVGGKANANVEAFKAVLKKSAYKDDLVDYTEDLQHKAKQWLEEEMGAVNPSWGAAY
jgi:hypothetical protein